MPIGQKIKVALYIILWFVISLSISMLTSSILIGFIPTTIVGVWAIYLFYPKFDPFSSIRFDNSKKLVALTFDDGPTSGFTEAVLKILKEKSVKASFFMIGEKADKNKDLVLQVLKEGHEIGAHTYTHKKLHLASLEEIKEQVGGTIQMIRSIYADSNKADEYRPIFRAPHGFKSLRLKTYLRRQQIALVPWTRGVWDTSEPGHEWVFEKATHAPGNNEILLFHDGKGLSDTVTSLQKDGLLIALPKVIDFYKNKGYTFIKVSDFIR
ncbi:MAG: polysaccharide deacetylase family protein [bacterium]